MRQILFVLLASISLSGCSGLQKTSPVLMALGSVAGAYYAKESLAVAKKDQEVAAEIRQVDAENTCVSQLRGSIDNWPRICEKTTLSRMDACGRAGFESTPLCTGYLHQYVARTQKEQQPTQQQVSQAKPVETKKKPSAKKPVVKKPPAVAEKEKPTKASTKKGKKKQSPIIKVGGKSI